MTEELIARREAAMDAADRALEAAWPTRQGAAFVSAMRAADEALREIAVAMERAGTASVERSRLHRYRGNILSDLAPALGPRQIQAALEQYRLAEALLEPAADPREHAKLGFSIANALRQLDPPDPVALGEAERRLLAARQVFEALAPKHLSSVDQCLASTRALRAQAPVRGEIDGALADMAKLQARLAAGEDPAKLAPLMAEVMKRGGGTAGMFAKVHALVEGLPESARADPRYALVAKELDEVASMGGVPAGKGEASAVFDILERLVPERATGDRATQLQEALAAFRKVMSGEATDLPGMMAQLEEMRKVPQALLEASHYPSHGLPRPPAGARASELVERFWQVRRALFLAAAQREKGERESKTTMDLIIGAAKLDRRIYEAGGDDERTTALERDALRAFIVEVRRFSARNHPLLVSPLWRAPPVAEDPNAVLLSGAGPAAGPVKAACEKLGLDLLGPPRADHFAQERWRQLQRASVGVFDLTSTGGPARAAVAYELGIHRALGRPVVILAAPDQRLPFDVDVPPTLVDGSDGDARRLREALDEAVHGLTEAPRSDAPADAAGDAVRRFSVARASGYVRQTLTQLERLCSRPGEFDDRPDPLVIGAVLKSLVEYLQPPQPQLVFPPWRPRYRKAGAPLRLFHVMPYGPAWATAAAASAERACEAAGIQYVRGDRVDEPDVIRSIWEELNLASHVLVDLTGFNDNVAVELGIAHLLGRSTLVVGQPGTVGRLFPAIAQHRFSEYSDPGSELQRLVAGLLSRMDDRLPGADTEGEMET